MQNNDWARPYSPELLQYARNYQDWRTDQLRRGLPAPDNPEVNQILTYEGNVNLEIAKANAAKQAEVANARRLEYEKTQGGLPAKQAEEEIKANNTMIRGGFQVTLPNGDKINEPWTIGQKNWYDQTGQPPAWSRAPRIPVQPGQGGTSNPPPGAVMPSATPGAPQQGGSPGATVGGITYGPGHEKELAGQGEDLGKLPGEYQKAADEASVQQASLRVMRNDAW